MTAGVRVLPANAPEELWLQQRRTGIGASEVAAVAGLSRRRGPWDVWSSKVHGTDLEPSNEMRWGQFIEGRIVDWWARETGVVIDEGDLFRNPDHPWLIATPDALVVRTPPTPLPPWDWEVVAVVDAKNAGWHMAGDWIDDTAPIEYVCQITWQMLAVGVTEGYLVAAIGGKPPVERHFTLDDDLAGELIARGEAFWQLVETQTPPPLDGSASAGRWLAKRYPDADPDASVDLDDDDIAHLVEWQALDDRITDLEQAKAAEANAVKERLGSASSGIYKGLEVCTWKTITRAGYTVRPTTYRKFHIPKAVKKELGDSK